MPNVECWLGSFSDPVYWVRGSFENFKGSGPVLLRNSIFLRFFRGGGPDPLSPLWIHAWDRIMNTENPFYLAHRLLYDTLRTFYRMLKFLKIDETFFPEFHSGLIWMQTVFANLNREKERETGICTSFQSASADGQVERERECVFFLNFVIFLTLRTRLRISKFRLYIFRALGNAELRVLVRTFFPWTHDFG